MCTSLKSVPSNASLCKKCGKCEKHCPQGIKIPNELAKVKTEMEKPYYHIFMFFARMVGKYGKKSEK